MQRTALKFHCRLAVETMHPRYTFKAAMHSVILTINSGYE